MNQPRSSRQAANQDQACDDCTMWLMVPSALTRRCKVIALRVESSCNFVPFKLYDTSRRQFYEDPLREKTDVLHILSHTKSPTFAAFPNSTLQAGSSLPSKVLPPGASWPSCDGCSTVLRRP